MALPEATARRIEAAAEARAVTKDIGASVEHARRLGAKLDSAYEAGNQKAIEALEIRRAVALDKLNAALEELEYEGTSGMVSGAVPDKGTRWQMMRAIKDIEGETEDTLEERLRQLYVGNRDDPLRFTPEGYKRVLKDTLKTAGADPRKVTSKRALEAAKDAWRSGEATRRMLKGGSKALATGVAAKLMLGGAAKAAGLPGVGEAAEMVGREDPSLQQFFREQEEGITGALGLPQRSQMPVYSMEPARMSAAQAALRTGRQGLRPAFDEPPITKKELEYAKKAAPRAK